MWGYSSLSPKTFLLQKGFPLCLQMWLALEHQFYLLNYTPSLKLGTPSSCTLNADTMNSNKKWHERAPLANGNYQPWDRQTHRKLCSKEHSKITSHLSNFQLLSPTHTLCGLCFPSSSFHPPQKKNQLFFPFIKPLCHLKISLMLGIRRVWHLFSRYAFKYSFLGRVCVHKVSVWDKQKSSIVEKTKYQALFWICYTPLRK